MDFPQIDPVALQLGPFAIRWYALAYLAGFLGGWRYGLYLAGLGGGHNPSKAEVDDFIAWAIAGVILGGRLGYVLFYNAAQYIAHPAEILQIWQGGMSFHGGVAGLVAVIVIFARRRSISPRSLADIVCCAAPIGIFFGRIANFVNGELYGRVTDVPWAVKFPHGDFLPRHPSQLYEAFLEGFVLFFLLLALAHFRSVRQKPGLLTGIFLCGYGAFRIFVEQFREPDSQLGFIFEHISMGQILSVPLIILGTCVISYAVRHPKTI